MTANTNHTIIEVTGPPGAGKSTYIDRHLGDRIVYQGYSPSTGGRTGRVMRSIFFPIRMLASCRLSWKQFTWLMRMASRLDDGLIERINAFRNAWLKFSLKFDEPKAGNAVNSGAVVIDEGISHIPFIMELRKEQIDRFLELFGDELKGRLLVLMEPPSEEELLDRLRRRGHRRGGSEERLRRLARSNLASWRDYCKSLEERELAWQKVPFRPVNAGQG